MSTKQLPIIGILLMTLMITACSKKEIKNDLEIAGLKGKVKSITIKESLSRDEEMYISEIHRYNLMGYEVEKEEFYDGEVKIKYSRDDKNNIIEEKGVKNHPEYIYNWIIKNKFNNENKLIESTRFNDNKISTINEFKYDINGNLISDITTYPKEDANINSTSYKYDENKNIIEKIEQSSSSKDYYTKWIFKHDSNNNKIYESELDKTGETGKSTEYKYDDKNNVIEEKYSYKNKKPLITKFYYNENKLIEEKRFNKEGSLELIISYEYDKEGNWIKKTYNDTNGNLSITLRLIEYYSDDEKTSPEIKEDTEPAGIEEKINENDISNNVFQGQELKTGERIVKINWYMENKTNYSGDMSYSGSRYASKLLTVPNGKKWILLYINEDFTFESGHVVGAVPDLFIDNRENIIGNRRFSNENNINLSRAKDENIKAYSGSTIKAISSRTNGNGPGDNFIEYKGEMWFLEIND